MTDDNDGYARLDVLVHELPPLAQIVPPQPSCCQSAARTALLEAAEEFKRDYPERCSNRLVVAWLTTRAGGPRT